MKITFVKEDVIEGLQKAASIIPQRSGATYLRSLWIKATDETVSIMATDANIEFCGSYPANVEKIGIVGVQGRAFIDLIKQMPSGKIKLNVDAETNTLLIEQGRRIYKLPANDAVWFENFSPFPTENAITWSGDFLQDILDKVTFCISDDDTMDAIACLYMKPVFHENGDSQIEVCGLNGHQFALVSFKHDNLEQLLPKEGILLQKKYLQELRKWLGIEEIELNITDKRLFIRTLEGGETISMPRAAFTYPDYGVFLEKISDDSDVLQIDRKECADALSRISIFNTNSDRCTYFDLTPDEAILSAQGQDVGSANESLEINYQGGISRIAFPTKDLMDIMGHFVSEKLVMILTGTEGPCGIKGKDDLNYTVIVMPMKVANTTYYSEDNV